MNHKSDKFEELHSWLALAIGNSRLHWGYFERDSLIQAWDTPHLSIAVKSNQLPQEFLRVDLSGKHKTQLPIYLASVVPEQTKLWQNYDQLNLITLEHIELQNLYPTLGVDRALVAWGAIEIYNRSCLVIDGGTALTFTGVNEERKLIGGGILPGLRSQLTALKQKTAALPEVNLPSLLPKRWAMGTDDAIASGIIYGAIATIDSYINNWLELFPSSQVIFTGGDGELLAKYFKLQYPDNQTHKTVDYKLIFHGIKLAFHNISNS